MLQKMRNARGQSTLEYAVLVVIIIAALLSLQAYIKRGVQGRLRKSTDDIGDQFATTGTSTYSRTVNSSSKTHDTVSTTGVTSSTLLDTKYVNTAENVTLDNATTEYGAGSGSFGAH